MTLKDVQIGAANAAVGNVDAYLIWPWLLEGRFSELYSLVAVVV
jgi:hypothetical protein